MSMEMTLLYFQLSTDYQNGRNLVRSKPDILILSLISYWHNVLEAVVSDLWTIIVNASAERCLNACTVFLYLWTKGHKNSALIRE